MPAKPLPEAQLKQSLLLAALLHVWLVLLLGNAPGGTAKPGEGVWGRLNITLRGPENGEPSGRPQLPPAPDDNAGPVGQAKQARFGGAPRPLPAADQPRPTQPGAAQLGTWQAAAGEGQAEAPTQAKPSPQPSVATEARPVTRPETAAVAAPPPAPAPVPAPAPAPAQPAPFLVPAVPALAALPKQALPVPAPLNVPQFEALPAAPEAPAQPKTFEAAPAPAVQRARPAPLLLKPGGAQAAPQALDLAPALPALQARPEPRPAPVPESLPVPVPVPSVVAAPELAAPAPPLPPVKSLAEPAPLPSLAAQPLQAPSALKPLPPSALERAPALPPAPAVPAPAPATTPAQNPAAAHPAAEVPAAAQPAASLQDRSSVRLGQPGQPSPQARFGTPDAGSRLGHDVATPPSAAASAPQAPLQLNLSLPPRPRGGELSGRGSRGVLDLLPTPPERKSKLSQEMENAAKQDCRKAYGEAGLLAVVPLAVDALRDKGCRW
ncbi:hypothetical protein DBR47_04805 [Paucibacter sp. KBW04]|uniref:hypothetical protein n=1 Tax=Paucibacter sp. KBW04 TaxID=2153361 RepID=UPI000F5644CA|nr:hypothetical protein [Paucibacter sp. KBW04]RQO62546.1 hypothetical protein DBR47_04805 [Paucibacter sp. KBW04]